MPRVPLLRPSDVVKAFQGLGWEVVRQSGSHIILVRASGAVE
jgi:predicted RNA binding protein YcfA (HicA-like mRNA interferase family)